MSRRPSVMTMRMMTELRRHPWSSAAEIGDAIGVSGQQVSAFISNGRRRGVVETRGRAPNRHALTAEGERQLSAMADAAGLVAGLIEGDLTPEEALAVDLLRGGGMWARLLRAVLREARPET